MKDLRNNLILGGLIGLTALIVLLLYTDLQALGDHVRAFPPLLILPVLLLTLYNYLLRFLKWHYYLHIIGIKSLSVIDSAALFVSGFVLAISPGKVAELLKAVVLRTMTGTPVARSIPVIPAERATDGLGMLVLGAIGFTGMLYSSDALAFLQQYIPAYLVVLGILLIGIILVQWRRGMLAILGWVEGLPLVGRFSHQARELYESSYDLLRPRPLLLAVGLGVLSWAGECVGAYLILVGLGIEASWLLLWQATFILAAATIIGAVSGLPGGLGAAEFSIVGLIQVLVLGTADAGLAGTAALLIRVSTLWFGVLLGLATAFAFRRRLFPERLEQSWRQAKSERLAEAASHTDN